MRALVEELQGRSIEVVEANSAEDGTSVITSGLRDPRRADRLVAGRRRRCTTGRARSSRFVRSRNDKIPIFLMAERGRGHRRSRST